MVEYDVMVSFVVRENLVNNHFRPNLGPPSQKPHEVSTLLDLVYASNIPEISVANIQHRRDL